jgi:hypothetical protein
LTLFLKGLGPYYCNQAIKAGEKYFVDELGEGKTFEQMVKETGTL